MREEAAEEPTFKDKMRKMMEVLKTTKYKGNYRIQKKIDSMEPLYDIHEFWDSQPVPKAYDEVDETMWDKPIDVEKRVSDVLQEPYKLPPGYVWADIDITDRVQAEEVYQLLTQNYVEDDDNMFRFDYSIEFL